MISSVGGGWGGWRAYKIQSQSDFRDLYLVRFRQEKKNRGQFVERVSVDLTVIKPDYNIFLTITKCCEGLNPTMPNMNNTVVSKTSRKENWLL